MSKLRRKVLAVSCGLALIGGCAYFDRKSQTTAVPVSNVTHSAAVTDPHYQIGRSHQARLQYDAAIAAYRKSLEANPGNAEAHNALGVIYASQGKYELAVTELKAALALAPRAAHIHNNLGYAYLLQGRNAEALAALNVAAGLDPANVRARENMKLAEQRLGSQASGPANSQVATAVVPEVKSPPQTAETGQTTRLLSVAPNIYELRQVMPTQVKPALPLAAQTAPETVRLEVANGNGVTGLAKRTSSSLKRKGYAVARLTNQAPYTQMITEIQYRQGLEQQARRLNAFLSTPAKLVETSQLRRDVGVRLVLGRDAVERPIFAETENPQQRALARP